MNLTKFIPKRPKLSFSDLDTPYQYHFIKELAFTAVGFIVCTVFFVFIRQWLYILFAFLIAAGYALYVIWQIYKSLSNQVLVVDAKCMDLERKENKLFGALSKEATTSKTCTLLLENEEGLKFTQPVAFSSSYKTGDIVRIYADDGSISQLNQNTYTIINPIFMHVLKS
ncbi:hypothetical protein [Butyrivibrio sp. AC2005]|uniref:hypothetical protein n=1 Tax=Butyrivibrio sp. AC2005 TaxID=1280672 RepID=UPI0004118CEA|nr:hypothetical protein [Butyrivibrio sp. AC2005]